MQVHNRDTALDDDDDDNFSRYTTNYIVISLMLRSVHEHLYKLPLGGAKCFPHVSPDCNPV